MKFKILVGFSSEIFKKLEIDFASQHFQYPISNFCSQNKLILQVSIFNIPLVYQIDQCSIITTLAPPTSVPPPPSATASPLLDRPSPSPQNSHLQPSPQNSQLPKFASAGPPL